MGGCKCSYRECKQTSNSKTHFFHYPVLDVERCLQWITNARRHEFEDLTPSQIRNRVICQHHFKDNMFMNFKHNKLVHNAVPTEDGPYMTSSNEDMKENVIIRPKYTQTSVDLPTSSREATTFIVNESPFNGYTFLEPDKKIQKTTENYVEFLTRKQDGLLEIARRRMVENLNTSIKNTQNSSSRRPRRNVPTILAKNNKEQPTLKKELNVSTGTIMKLANNADVKIDGDNGLISKKDNGKHTTLGTKLHCKDDTMTPMTKFVNDADVKGDISKSIRDEGDVENQMNTRKSIESVNPAKQILSSENRKSIPPTKLIEVIFDEKLPVSAKPCINPLKVASQVHPESNFTPLPADSTKINSFLDLYHEPDSTKAELLLLPEVKKLPVKGCMNIISNTATQNVNVEQSRNDTHKVITLPKDSILFNAMEVPVLFQDLDDQSKYLSLPLDNNNVTCQSGNQTSVQIIKPTTDSAKLKPANHKTEYKKSEGDIPAEVKVNINLIEKIEQNSREIAELKNLILNGCETVAKNNKRRTVVRRQSTGEETRKVELYEEISKYLSREVSSLVHNELFPSKRRRVWKSKC